MTPPAWLTELRNGVGIARRIPALSVRERGRWLAAAAHLPRAARRTPPRCCSVPARLPDGAMVDLQVGHSTDLAVIAEVLYEQQYAAPELHAPSLIVDAGSHIGTSVLWFASRYPDCRVVAFEASPRTFARLRHNVRDFPNVEVHNIALGACDGEVVFFEGIAPWASSLRPRDNPRSTTAVPVLTLDSALRLAGANAADLLKLDIEGAEYEVLRACPPRPARVHRIVGELHTWIDGVGFTEREFFALLEGYDVQEDESGGDHMFRAIAEDVAAPYIGEHHAPRSPCGRAEPEPPWPSSRA